MSLCDGGCHGPFSNFHSQLVPVQKPMAERRRVSEKKTLLYVEMKFNYRAACTERGFISPIKVPEITSGIPVQTQRGNYVSLSPECIYVVCSCAYENCAA